MLKITVLCGISNDDGGLFLPSSAQLDKKQNIMEWTYHLSLYRILKYIYVT